MNEMIESQSKLISERNGQPPPSKSPRIDTNEDNKRKHSESGKKKVVF